MLDGTVEHRDSLGNHGTLGKGDVQWMTAGRGIMHQEMPQGDAQGRMHGFQLWANLPSSLKMTAPRYQDVKGAEIPEDHRRRRHARARGVRRVLGQEEARSKASPPIRAISTSSCRRASARRFKVEIERHAFAYVFEGDGKFAYASKPLGVLSEKQVDGEEILFREPAGDRSLVLFDRGDEVTVQAGDNGIRFLLVSGKPIEEPVAWYGPIVMNTQSELQQAVSELRSGTFIRD